MSVAAEPRGRWDGRHRAREAALRALYQMAVGGLDAATAVQLTMTADDDGVALDAEQQGFALRLAGGAWAARTELDAIIEPLSTNWRLDRLAVVDHLVLRLAIHEWLAEPGTPPRVVLSEALDLAREYSGEAAVRFVNGVLDAAYRQLRDDGRIIEQAGS
ncbi:MAG: transcription antitermination factor NusB [Vicinamibacterales bacterium]